MNRICPECGSRNLPEIAVCNCGRPVAAVKPRRRVPIYLAAFPLVIPVVMMFRSATPASVAASNFASKRRAPVCVETYGIKLTDGQILSGTAKNTCEDPVRNVRLTVSAIDERGKRRIETVEIRQLDAGGAKRFERVLGSRVRSWDILSDK
jgi:hypothetical protein